MTETPKPTYRRGDVVLCKGTVTASEHDESVYVQFAKGTKAQLRADDVESVVTFSIAVGMRVKWRDGGEWRYGNVLGMDVDVTLPSNPKTWAWIREDGRWPRLTLPLEELRRA
jgi:hypothetical protein